jgi:hypothetical protein
VARTATQTTDDVGAVHSLLRTLPSTVALLSTVLAELVLVVSEGTVERSEFSELVPLVVGLVKIKSADVSFARTKTNSVKRNLSTHRLDDLVDQFDTRLDLELVVAGDKTMKLVLFVLWEPALPAFAILDGAFTSDRDLCARLPLHPLERVATWAHEQTEKVDLGELLDGDVHFVLRFLASATIRHVGRGSEVGVGLHGPVDETGALFLELLPVPDVEGVGPSTVSVIVRRRRR